MTATRWFVITGAPSSGKTTVLNKLEDRGFKCTPEAARTYIDSQLALGLTISEMRKDEMVFQRSLISAKIDIEMRLDHEEIVFMDRAMPDSISYFKLKGIDTSEIVELSKRFRYGRVFQFDRLPFEEDGARVEDEQSAAFLDRQLELDYRSLGYDVIRVPAMSIEERVKLLLEFVEIDVTTSVYR